MRPNERASATGRGNGFPAIQPLQISTFSVTLF
jgi:hypothetical protein